MAPQRDNKDQLSTPPQTEDSAERGWVEKREGTEDPMTYDDLGRSDQLQTPDDVGDIADEGPGHRG
jgi:hypothetical protein